MKNFANLLSGILLVLLLSDASFGQGSVYNDTGTPGAPVDPTCAGGEAVLLIQDVVPWAAGSGQDPNGANFDELEAQGKNWCSVNSNQIPTPIPTGVGTIIIASAQTQTFYNNLFPGGNIHPAISTWLSNGGLLLAHMADHASGPGAGGTWDAYFLPGGVQHTLALSQDDDIGDSAHPLISNGLTCPSNNCGQIVDTAQFIDLDGYTESDHGYFTGLPEGTDVILIQGPIGPNPGFPVTVEYSVGSGRVLATMATIEWRYVGGSADFGITFTPNKKLLANEFALTDTQVTTTPATNFNANPSTDTTVSVVFNNNSGQHVQADAIFPGSNNLTFPTGIDPTTVNFRENNSFVSDCRPYTAGTPFATCIPFDHAGNDAIAGTSGNGAKYEITCGDATHSPSEANCPTPSTGYHIRFKDIFDLPTNGSGFIQPAIPFGTTVSFIHWYPNLGGANSTSWTASNASPHPDCTNVFTPGFACDFEDALVNKYAASNAFGSDTKKGDYLLAYNIPMLCSSVKVNTMAVNTACTQSNTVFFFHSPLTFDFLVTPAKCPTGETCDNGWIPAPVHDLFYTLDPFSSAPDLPGATDFEDTAFCPGDYCPTAVPNGVDCPSANCTTSGTPGGSAAVPVEFTTAPMAESNEGQFLLQFAARDSVKITERNIQILTKGSCPNPFNDSPAPTPPCYSTKLFNFPIVVDNTAPTVTGLTLTPNTQIPGKTITANYTCADSGNSTAALNSGLASCGTNLNLNKSTEPGPLGPLQLSDTPFTVPQANGPQTYKVTATDVAGNSFTATANYFAGYQFLGFFPPLTDPNPSNTVGPFSTPIAVNPINAKQAVPIKWQVLDGNGVGVTGLTLAPAGTVIVSAYASGVCTNPNSVDTAPIDVTSVGSGLQDLGGGNYQLNGKSFPKGCIDLVINPGDGTQHHAYFLSQ